MSEMKTCPFCKSENVATRDWWNSLHDTCYFAECLDCGCMAGFMVDPSGWVGAAYATEAEAIEAWNTRAEQTCKPTEEDCCSICGEDLVKCNVGIGELGGAVELDSPIYHNYCPSCGAKVVSE